MYLIRQFYARLRRAFPINRVVALLTAPAAALAGYVATWVAENFPGVTLDEGSLTAVFVAGAAAVVVMAYRWLDGWMRYEAVLLDATEELHRRKKARRAR